MVNQNDVVSVEGKESTVETTWGAGTHRVFKLADGREILDLDKLIASGKASIVKQASTKTFSETPIAKTEFRWPKSKE